MKSRNYNDFDCSSFIFITGGVFQGKSLISIKIAERYKFSGILGTDHFRNILRIQNPSKEILCSTSKLNKELFNKQREKISELLFKVLPFYAERKEKIIIEGIHFSKDFLNFVIKNGAKCFYLENKNSWEEKVFLKRITTPITKFRNEDSKKEYLIEHTDDINIKDISYIQKENKYKEINDIIISDIDKLKIIKISFKELNMAFGEICKELNKYNSL